tara:strand:+ start:482 stop:1045 length:564 start_codon:yes stop_codon:yes gene_type:complete
MKLSDFCRCYTNAADDNLVKDMLEWFESDDEAKTVTANRDTRKDLQKWVPVGTTLYNRIEQVKRKTLDLYLDEFPYVYKGSKQLVSEETKIQRTDTQGGGFHNFHSEISHYKNIRRVLVWTLYLNDIPENEGETEFLLEKIKIQPKKGMMCIFPASFPWQHRGNPVHMYNKYISTGWWLFPEEGRMD